ncbi:MAG: dienelactone hydrolase family protein [Proteobacteria bacterium]|nr:dienelactone hydrolase family protein [Pseudomonadota bacterium]
MKNLFIKGFLLNCLFMHATGNAKLVESNIEYKEGKSTLEGYLVYDDAIQNRAPGILVTHNWMGISDTTKYEAQELAKKGYVAFAADIYGKDIRPKNQQEAGALAGLYKKDRKLFRERMKAGLKALLKQKNVDSKKIAAIGFCFGGTGVIELARSGAKINAAVSFHGGLDSPKAEDGKNIKAKILALHGAIDPYVSTDELTAFEDEMKKYNVDFQIIKYGGAVHSFTDKSAGNDIKKGAAYNESADRRSHLAMDQLFKEIF